jgi:hypothetical protein
MRRAAYVCASVGLAALSAALSGCLPGQQPQTTRSQVAEDPADADQFATVGARTAVGNVEPIQVSGVGLVYGLAGTGSVPQPDNYRTVLEQAIRRQRGNPREILDDPAKLTSLVLVSTMIPPGARVGDTLDAAVSLPPASRTTSLANGLLAPTEMHNYELAGAARDALQSAGLPVGSTPAAADSTLLTGNKMATAEGALVAGYDGTAKLNPDSPDGPKAARVWGGVRCQIDRPYYFLLNDSSPQPRLALAIAARLNEVFPPPAGEGVTKLAEAKVQGRPIVVTFVPPTYRHNHNRYLLVARQVPLNAIPADSPYRKTLENDLLRPELAVKSAIKLEALGSDSRPALRVGLESDSPWVRFAAAESLAYLGHADGAKALAELATAHRALRTQCLTALASLDDAVSLDQLAELTRTADPQLRYGAFVALRLADPKHEAVRNKTVDRHYEVFHVAPDTQPMVHVNSDRRSEVVFFGSRLPLRTPFSIPLGKTLSVTARAGEPTVTVTRITTDKDGEPTTAAATCLTDLAAVVKLLGDSGATFAEVVDFVRRAETAEVVTTAVKYNETPRALTITQLATISVSDPEVMKADLEVARVGAAPGVVPAHYDLPVDGQAIKAQVRHAEEPALNREPGRLFGPRKATPLPDPLAGR